MIIQKTHQTISALSRVIPNAFLFVIDTTDRTFLFTSKKKGDFQSKVVQFDQEFGIDKLTQSSGYHFDTYDSASIGFRNIGTNTYLGFCIEEVENISQKLFQAQKLVLE